MNWTLRFNHGWLLILLALFFVTLTCLQARGSVLTNGIHFINQSGGYSLFVFRVTSELAGISLSAAISASLERIKWTLPSLAKSKSRTQFQDFLALDESTKVLALVSLVAKGRMLQTRLWSIARLLFILVIPISGIMIMSQVDIRLAFSAETRQKPYMGHYIHPMNSSMAIEYLGFSDLVLSSKLSGFLQDPLHSVELGTTTQQQTCILNANGQGSSDCHRRYFIPGDVLIAAPHIVNDASFPGADIIMANEHQGLLLDFDAGDSTMEFNMTSECRTYSSRYLGFEAGAIHLCVGRSGPTELQARLVSCPSSIAIVQRCMNDSSWHHNADWTVKMSASFQNASVAYSRNNGTIIWYSFADTPAVSVEVEPSQILAAYDSFFFDTTTLLHKNSSDLPLFSGSISPTFLWMTEPLFSGQNATNPATNSGAFSTLRALLAVPLYLCQNGLGRRLLSVVLESKSISEGGGLAKIFEFLSPIPEPTSPFQFAYHRWEVVASMPTLVAYMALSGAALLACCAAQLSASIAAKRVGRCGMPKPSRFPALDLFAHCTIEDKEGCIIYQGRPSAFQSDVSKNNQMVWLSTLGVKWSGPVSVESGLQLCQLHEVHGLDSERLGTSAESLFPQAREE